MDKLIREGKWVVGVSGGADSMALLDMCYEHGVHVVAAHVNYKKRDTADRDMYGVMEYCKKRGIPCFVKEVTEYAKQGNFQAQAREIRYAFFKELVEEKKCCGVLVAHQEDDVLETYLMQKKRNSVPSYYGIKESGKWHGMLVKRPLLAYTKKDLMHYCINKGIAYYEDESNASDVYTRNKIRHEEVETWTVAKRKEVLEEMRIKNESLQTCQKKAQDIVGSLDGMLPVAQLLSYAKDLQKAVLRAWVESVCHVYTLSEKNIQTFIALLEKQETTFQHTISDVFYWQAAYGNITIEEVKERGYAYEYASLSYESTPYFTLCEKGKTIEGLTLYETDFPITIRNAKKGDKIKLRMGTKKVSRYFIDAKISHKERELWPVVVNCEGNVIFVSGIGCDIAHYSNNLNMFVVK